MPRVQCPDPAARLAQLAQVGAAIGQRLAALCAAEPMVEALGAQRAAALREMLARDPACVAPVRGIVHAAILEGRSHALGRWALWDIYDAVGALGDCVPGRWQYFSEADAQRNYVWAGEYIDSVEAAVACAAALRKAARSAVASA